MEDIKDYLDSWVQRRIDYELVIKGRAKLNSGSWRKLRNYHLQDYVGKLDNQFSFLFNLKFRYRNLNKHLDSLGSLYQIALRKRQEKFDIVA
jgi:hypothetical protein